MREHANQSVNGITSCDSLVIVSFINAMQMSFIHIRRLACEGLRTKHMPTLQRGCDIVINNTGVKTILTAGLWQLRRDINIAASATDKHAHTCARTHARTHARPPARTHTHTHTHTLCVTEAWLKTLRMASMCYL